MPTTNRKIGRTITLTFLKSTTGTRWSLEVKTQQLQSSAVSMGTLTLRQSTSIMWRMERRWGRGRRGFLTWRKTVCLLFRVPALGIPTRSTWAKIVLIRLTTPRGSPQVSRPEKLSPSGRIVHRLLQTQLKNSWAESQALTLKSALKTAITWSTPQKD